MWLLCFQGMPCESWVDASQARQRCEVPQRSPGKASPLPPLHFHLPAFLCTPKSNSGFEALHVT